MRALIAILAAATAVLMFAQESGTYQGIKEDLPAEVAPQPVPFSHKQHVGAGSECKDCHPKAYTADFADLPGADRCMLCHRAIATDSPHIRKIAQAAEEGERIRWVRIYRVPDFVFFSHVNHVKAGEKCETCHGPVAKRDVLAKEVSTSMTTCMNCHAERDVSNECHFCHQLGF